MAGCGYGTCSVFLLLVVCLVYVADCRGGRGGSRGGFRGGYRYSGGISGGGGGGGGGGGESTAITLGIVFGSVGGLIVLVIILYVCCSMCFDPTWSSKSSSNAAKKSSPGKVNSKPKQAYSTTSAPFDPGNASYSSPQNDQYKAQFNVDAPYSPYPVNPPSYRSAVAMADKDSLLYSPHR